MKTVFEDDWKKDALAYIERERSDERRAYLARLNPRNPPEEWEFTEHRTPKGVLVEAVVRSDGYVERWRLTYGEVTVTSGMDVSFADVNLGVTGHEWEIYADVPGWPHRIY